MEIKRILGPSDEEIVIKRIWEASDESMSPEIQKTLRPLLNTDRTYVSAFVPGLNEEGRFAINARYYTYYGAYIDDKPVGSLIVLPKTKEVSYIMADNLTIYEALVDVYKTEFDGIPPPRLRRNVSRIPPGAPPMHILGPGQKQQQPFNATGDWAPPIGSVPEIRLPLATLSLDDEPKTYSLKEPGPTTPGMSAFFNKPMGGTRRRRRNLRKKNKKTRKWTSSATRTRSYRYA